MSRPVATLLLPANLRKKLVEAGFRRVGDLKDVGPVALARELGVTPEKALEVRAHTRAPPVAPLPSAR